jgi:hypothetical protein
VRGSPTDGTIVSTSERSCGSTAALVGAGFGVTVICTVPPALMVPALADSVNGLPAARARLAVQVIGEPPVLLSSTTLAAPVSPHTVDPKSTSPETRSAPVRADAT